MPTALVELAATIVSSHASVTSGKGTIAGTLNQTVSYGASTSQVSAVPARGYRFTGWTGTNGFVPTTTNPMTLSNVTTSQTITANFAPYEYTLTFSPSVGGSLSGDTSQTVPYNGSSTAVTAVPNAGYRFVNWTGDNGFSTTTINPLIVKRVKTNQNITANFAVANQLTIKFSAGAHGSVKGETVQTVNYAGSTSAVTAVPAKGYSFVGWTGNNGFVPTMENPLVLNNVTASQKVKANFAR